MNNPLRYNIADERLTYNGNSEPIEMNESKVSSFNFRHQEVLNFYGLELAEGTVFMIDEKVNGMVALILGYSGANSFARRLYWLPLCRLLQLLLMVMVH
jgi:hypothetical protein